MYMYIFMTSMDLFNSVVFVWSILSCLHVCVEGCVEKADIVFLIDASGSVRPANFKKELEFASEMVGNLTIGSDYVHIGVVTFDSQAYMRLKIGQYNETATIQDAILKIPYTSRGTSTDVALQFVLTKVFVPQAGDRPNAKDVLVVLTDGVSIHPANTAKQAYFFKEKHIQVISVGIGGNTNKDELTDMASVPEYVFNVQDFSKLATLQATIKALACNTDAIGCVEKADIVFLVDASGSVGATNFKKELEFVSTILSNFTIDPDHVQVGVVTFDSKTYLRIKLNQYNDTKSIQNAVKGIPYTGQLTKTDIALQFILSKVFVPSAGDRSDAKDVLVILTDGVSGNPLNTAKQAYIYKEKHIQVISVGIGRGANKEELTNMASVPGYVFQVTDFSKLLGIQKTIHALSCNNDVITTPSLQWMFG
ncbi:matrilin-1-like [Mytilus galloprovincialis]|uniref:matrilin-1-like n=1 Tax=Mytilus galloprovincialis TaxID=29158 RepID=UPI003F7CD2D6